MHYPNLWGQFYTNTMFVQIKSVHGYNTAQIYTNGLGYDQIYPMTGCKEVPHTLMSFIQDVGIPQELVSDNAPKQVHRELVLHAIAIM